MEKEKIASVCAAMKISEEKAGEYLSEYQIINPLPLNQSLDASVKDIWNAPLDPYLLPPEPYVIRKEAIRRMLSFIGENLSADKLDTGFPADFVKSAIWLTSLYLTHFF